MSYFRMDWSLAMLTPHDLISRAGREGWPLVFDVRSPKDAAARPRFLPAARPANPGNPGPLKGHSKQKLVVVYCTGGCGRSEQALKALRKKGFQAKALEGGLDGWIKAGGPTVGKSMIKLRAKGAPSRWLTRERPKIDRVAVPWLIRRFLDPEAEIFYADPAKIREAARKLRATPFDIPGATRFSHEGERCSFDYFIKHFGICDAALDDLATIVRGADTGRLDLAYPCAGLLAVSLGLSALYAANDEIVLEKGMLVYDALYAWIRFASGEKHNWPKPATGKAA
ncbi:MAG TPA: chromate resistance protein ChrB domain-containing protein [Sphingomonadales bacterium]|nr:chromate resistance protein ChrB domain-containing protein [Sphingomonadales bacterium]